MLHIAFDDDANGKIPIVGFFCREFTVHHEHPRRICEPLELCRQACSTIPLMVLWYYQTLYCGTSMVGCKIMCALGFCVTFTHYNAHRATKDSWLMRHGLVLRTSEHHAHHATYDRSFCILTGWANPLVDYLFRHPRGLLRTHSLGVLIVYTFTRVYLATWFSVV
jgi:hypothetical protein